MSAAPKTDDLGKGLIAMAWTLFSVAFVIVALRVWTRVGYLKDRMALHDWLMICAIISEILHCTTLTVGQAHGLGRHIETLEDAQIGIVGHYVVISESFSVLTSYFGRMSFSAFMLTVVGVAAKPTKYTLWGVIVVNTIINLIVIVQVYAQCGVNMDALWNEAVAAVAHCEKATDETYLGYVQASINSLCDLILTVLPLSVVWGLKMPRATKVALGALLTLSSFALVASIAKAIEIRQLSNGPDFTYHFAVLQYCVVAENDVVMISASLPMLRALWIKNKKGTTDPSSGGYHSTNNAANTRKTVTNTNAGSVLDRTSDEEAMFHLPANGIQRTTETDVYVDEKAGAVSVVIQAN